MQDNATQKPRTIGLYPTPRESHFALLPFSIYKVTPTEGKVSAYPLGVLRLDALEAEAEDGLAQLVAQAAADDGLAQAAVVQRLAQRRRACAAASVSLTSRI